MSPTESGTDKSGESYRKWKQSEAVLCAASTFYSEKGLEDRHGTETTESISHRHEIYIRNLAKADDHVMSVSPQAGKETRPFVGIVIVCGTRKYCVPLSSPKPKHKSMKNDVDFTKIMDGEKLIGVLNFNNMIPVDESCTIPLNLRIVGKDDTVMRRYKKMAAKQLDWCQHNQEAIVKKANKLYAMVQGEKTSVFLKRRCCDFRKLEAVLQKWVENRNS